MPSSKTIGLLGLIAPMWFIFLYLVMSSLRPEYSHLTKAISELGSLDAPNKWVWNILGYILTGLAISLLSYGLWKEFRAQKRSFIPIVALTLSGLLMALSGIFPGDFDNRESLTMLLHTIGSLGSFAAFLLAGFWLPNIFRNVSSWRWIATPSVTLVVLSIVTGFLRSGSMPGLGQRLGFLSYFLWVMLVSYGLWRSQKVHN